jgi:hypothetical protein
MVGRIWLRACAISAIVAATAFTSISAEAAGALAIGSCGAYGDAYDFPTSTSARSAALNHCSGRCRVVATFRRGCAAFAIDAVNFCGAHGYATAPRLGAAQNAALRQCYRYGGKECVVRAWACDARG